MSTFANNRLGYMDSVLSTLEDLHSTNRRPRSLFPQRRITLSTFKDPMNTSGCGSPANEVLPAEDNTYDYHEKECSDDDSSSSSGTVKIAGLSKLASLGCKEWYPIGDFCPVEELHLPYPTYHSDEHPADVISRRCPPAPEITPRDSKDTLSSPLRSAQKAALKVRINSQPEICGSGTVRSCRSLPNLRGASQQYDLGIGDPTQSESAAHQIDSWDASIQLYANATICQQGEIKINYHARISVAIPKPTIDTGNVCLNLVIEHGIRGKRAYYLDTGHSSLYFGTETFSRSSLKPAKAEIAIIGNICDMERHLDLYFATSYPTSDQMGMQVLPSFRPAIGKVLSESVILGDPTAPLAIDIKKRSMYSSWEAVTHPLSNVTQFKRIDTPPLYPLGLRDDLRIRVIELLPVRFQSLGALTAGDVVWDLDVKIQQSLENELECRMSMYLEVPVTSNKLVTIDSHGWIPGFFLVDGGLATEQTAQWRQRNGQLTLFKQAYMLPGPIKLELSWHKPSNTADCDSNKAPKLWLPRVPDRKILSGNVTWKNVGLVCLADLGTGDHLEIEPNSSLPTMEKGYKLYIHRTVQEKSLNVQETTLQPDLKGHNNNPNDEGYATADDASDHSSGTADPQSGPEIENLGMQRPTLSPILEGRNDNSSNEDHPALDNDSDQSSANADSEPGPDLEAHDDPPPPDREEPREEVTIPSQATNRPRWAGPAALILLMVLLFFYFAYKPTSTQLPVPARSPGPGGESDSWAQNQLSREVERGSRHGDVATAHAGPERIFAGAETDGNEKKKREKRVGGRARDVFDYAFGWPGPL